MGSKRVRLKACARLYGSVILSDALLSSALEEENGGDGHHLSWWVYRRIKAVEAIEGKA
jgi:hypothetical protein